jgi:hypothetical protein
MSVSELENLSRHFDGPPSFKMSALAPIPSFIIYVIAVSTSLP